MTQQKGQFLVVGATGHVGSKVATALAARGCRVRALVRHHGARIEDVYTGHIDSREVARVLRPGGRFAIFDPVATIVGPPDFPLPWSRTPSSSFLVTADQMREFLLADGLFEIVSWQDKTADMLTSTASQPSPGIHAASEPAVTLAHIIGPEGPLWCEISPLVSNPVASHWLVPYSEGQPNERRPCDRHGWQHTIGFAAVPSHP